MTCGARAIAITDVDLAVDVLRERMTARALGLDVTRRRVAVARTAGRLRGPTGPHRTRVTVAVTIAALAGRGILRALREVRLHIKGRGNDMTLATGETACDVRRVGRRRRRIAVARIARGRSVLVARQARRCRDVSAEVLTMAALASREVVTAGHDLARVVHRETRRVDPLGHTIGTGGLLTFHRTTSEQHYDGKPLHR